MNMKVAVIANKASGQNKDNELLESINKLFLTRNIEANTYIVSGGEIKKLLNEIRNNNFDAIIAAGGDGTISQVAENLIGTGIPMGILPMGTFNHFAKDLNFPENIEECIQIIANRNQQLLDIGEVNGKVFINNSSVGIYPKAVKIRDKHIKLLGFKKSLSMIIALLSVFSRFPLFMVKLQVNNKTLIRRTSFVFVGNNEYRFDLFNLGRRYSLKDGKLSLYTAHINGRVGAIKIAFWALFNKLKEKDFDVYSLEEIKLETRRKKIHVALDGEVVALEAPLHYKIKSKELLVILPKGNH